MHHDTNSWGNSQLKILNVVVSTPESRGGAIRAGLQLGESLTDYLQVDNLKMAGKHDEALVEELTLDAGLSTIPSRTLFRDIAGYVINTTVNFENTVIWTELHTPEPLKHYDIVHVHNAVPLWGLLSVTLRCRIANVPYVVTTHGISKLPDLPDNADLSRLQSFIFKQLYLRPYLNTLANAAHLFALSKGDKQRLAEYVPGQSVSVVPNGVSINRTDKRTQAAVAEELQLNRDSPILLFVGKIMMSKGVTDLLDAYEELDTDCTLIVVGPSKDDELVERLNGYAQAEVRYLGYTEQDRLDALFKLADLFVFPTRADVFPLVTLEAMAAGAPVVTTNVGGLPEQISEETGILVRPEDPKAITRAVDEFLKDEKRLQNASDAALERVRENFSWEKVAEETATTYMDILKQQPTRSMG
jgi:glycosyltransferase involved in cell wall biosynthesis